jgi:hypothetical protein
MNKLREFVDKIRLKIALFILPYDAIVYNVTFTSTLAILPEKGKKTLVQNNNIYVK